MKIVFLDMIVVKNIVQKIAQNMDIVIFQKEFVFVKKVSMGKDVN